MAAPSWSKAPMSEPSAAPVTARPVVIVDDDVSCLVAVEQILRHWGHETRTFRAFADARAYLAQAQPAAVIVDVRLGNSELALARQPRVDRTGIANGSVDVRKLSREVRRKRRARTNDRVVCVERCRRSEAHEAPRLDRSPASRAAVVAGRFA